MRTPGVIAVAIAAVAVMGIAAGVHADPGPPSGPLAPLAPAGEPVPVPPGVLSGVDVVEKLGSRVPLDARFRDHTGKDVVLGDVVRGDLPVLLTFNYSSCPQLCDAQLKGLVAAMESVSLQPGNQFRIVTVILAPGEPPERAARTRAQYVKSLAEHDVKVADDGWTFLVSQDGKSERAIHAVAAATGFGYRYDERQDEYAHPATIVALSPTGTITRYVHGITPVGEDVELTIFRAGLSEPSGASGFLMSCFHWDPDGRAGWGRSLMRYGALGFASVFLLILGAYLLLRRSRHPSGVTPS
jgi:protein SCO1